MAEISEVNSQNLKSNDEKWRKLILKGQWRDDWEYADFMLQKVSRTYALNIRVLKNPLKAQVLLGYLLCRAADTIEDDPNLSGKEKSELLLGLKSLFLDEKITEEKIIHWEALLPVEWENSEDWSQLLTIRTHVLFRLLDQFHSKIQDAMKKWVSEMCLGMAQFCSKSDDENEFISDEKDLDQYCYYVAGTVGMLLCDLFYLNSSLISKRKFETLKKYAVSFGLGLQLTNIMKDIREDDGRGVSFLPHHLWPENVSSGLYDKKNRATAEKLLQTLGEKTLSHLRDALEYILILPRLETRIRLFCLWPLLMASETLLLTADADKALDKSAALKITRLQVKQIIQQSSWRCWSNSLTRKLCEKSFKKVDLLLKKAQ